MSRRSIRVAAALLSAGCAVVYLLIGLEVVAVSSTPPSDGSSMLAFGAPAFLAFAVGAVLLLTVDRRWLWVLGAALQVIVLVMYFAVAPTREPPFEPWGILLKVAQAAILAALVYLAVKAPPAGDGMSIRDRHAVG